MAFKIPETISEKELIQLVNDPDVKKNPKHRAGYILCFYQALRVSELFKLNPGDYNPADKLLHIRQSKRKKDRKIPISPKAVKALRYLPVRTEAKDFGVRAFQYALKKDGKKVLGKDLHPHTLRHSGATHYLNIKKWDTRQLQIFLGHSDIKITQVYTHVNPEDLTRIMWDGEAEE